MGADISELIEQIRAGLDQLKDWKDEKPSASFRAIPKLTLGDWRRLLEHIAGLEARTEWRDMESAPKDEEVLIAYWRWRNSMSPGSVVVQSAMLTEHHGKGIWSWVVSDNKHGPFPLRGYCEGDFIGWMPLPARPTQERT